MTNRVVLITGALTGIGRATALAFGHEGARVVISGRRDDEGQELVAELQKLGAEAEFLRCDVRYEDDVRHLIDKSISRRRSTRVRRISWTAAKQPSDVPSGGARFHARGEQIEPVYGSEKQNSCA